MKGQAYVFLRKSGAPLPTGCAGHVGWGFMSPDGCRFTGGATENAHGGAIVLPGGDIGFWMQECPNEAAMIDQMRRRNYDAYKMATVAAPDEASAESTAEGIPGGGYAAVKNNCLDHVCRVLGAYGVKDLPWALTHPSPNDWFAQFNGEYHNL